jgi:hypothetical protein
VTVQSRAEKRRESHGSAVSEEEQTVSKCRRSMCSEARIPGVKESLRSTISRSRSPSSPCHPMRTRACTTQKYTQAQEVGQSEHGLVSREVNTQSGEMVMVNEMKMNRVHRQVSIQTEGSTSSGPASVVCSGSRELRRSKPKDFLAR